MSKHISIRRVIVATAIATAIGLTSLAGGAASADGPQYYQALTRNEQIKDPMHVQSLAGGTAAADRVYKPLTFKKHIDLATPSTADDAPTEEVAFYYNRIAFNYAGSK